MRDHVRMDTRFLGIAELVKAPSVAVVVDVMRAFTVAAWAFAQGAEKIVLAESLDEALVLKARHPDWVALKDGLPAPGFDTVNSPGLLRSIDLGGRTVVQKTTAGTVGALAVKEASLVQHQVAGGGEPAHVEAYLGEDDLGSAAADPGH
jgi:2-phosphosulfolactate phosphatase